MNQNTPITFRELIDTLESGSQCVLAVVPDSSFYTPVMFFPFLPVKLWESLKKKGYG